MSKDTNTKNNVQIETVDKMIKLYPELKKDRASIITNIMGISHKDNTKEFEVVKFTFGDKIFYKDRNGSIWDATAKIVGVFECGENDYKYHFFKNIDDNSGNKLVDECCAKLDKIHEDFANV